MPTTDIADELARQGSSHLSPCLIYLQRVPGDRD